MIWFTTMDYKRFLAEAAERRDAMGKLREIGWTWRQIGEHYGVTPQRALQIGKKYEETKAKGRGGVRKNI